MSPRRIAVVTGASAGVGRATVRAFARAGFDVGLIARGEAGLAGAAADVEAAGGRALQLPTDVADFAAVRAAAQRVEAELGPIDLWVNDAFAGVFSPFMDMTMEEFHRVTEVTYLGQVHGTRAALEHMLPRDRGAIVLVGSALAYRGIPLQSAYCGAKHAIQGFQDSLRSELLHMKSRITLSMVQLPGVNTPQFDWIRTHVRGRPKPTGAIYQPEVAARAIRFAAESGRKEVIVGMPAFDAIWANVFASPLLDRYLARTGYRSQQARQPVSPDRRDNLFEPVPGDFGAHGRFDARSRRRSPQLWATMHRGSIAAGLGLALAAGLLFAGKRKDGKEER